MQSESIAFPLISSGIYGYPKDEALEVARQSIAEFLQDHDMDVYLAVFDKSSLLIGRTLLGKVESYIDQHYVDVRTTDRRRLLRTEEDALEEAQANFFSTPSMPAPMAAPVPAQGLDDLMKKLDEPFSAALLKLIDQEGKTDVQVYKRANIDRKLFSKIRTGKGDTPKKPTILALAIALELTLDETDTLLEQDTIGGFNSMLDKQKQVEGECRITTVLFDNRYELLHDRIDIKAVSPITEKEYQVRGSTALLDAVGQTIHKLAGVQKNTAEEYRAGNVMFVIITDGEENSSREYSAGKIKAMIEEEKKYGWEFVFLGANIDAVGTA